jgi:CRISPR-associated protein Csy2
MWLTISLDVQKASGKNAYCVYGNPSPFAFIGFSHALCARSGLEQEGGVLAIFHNIEMHANESPFKEYTFDMPRSAQRDSKETRNSSGKTQIDMPMVDLSVSLCFQCTSEKYDGLKNLLEETINEMRFAGGVISKSSFRMSETSDKAFKFKPGFVMSSALIEDGDGDIFTRTLQKISIQKGKQGWFSPSLVGFRLIEDPQLNRKGARGGHPHAYADPMIGVVQFKSARKANIDDLWSIEQKDGIYKFKTPSCEKLKSQQKELLTLSIGA